MKAAIQEKCKTFKTDCTPPPTNLDSDDAQACDAGKSCMCEKDPSDYPDHKWCVSVRGWEMFPYYVNEHEKRIPDSFDCYVYNDSAGWGISEGIDNMIEALNKELHKKKPNLYHLWSDWEGIAFYVQFHDLAEFFNNDDGEHVEAIIKVLGAALLCTMHQLVDANMFIADSPIPNLALIIGMILSFLEEYNRITGDEPETALWTYLILRLTRKHIKVDGLISEDLIDTVQSHSSEEEVETTLGKGDGVQDALEDTPSGIARHSKLPKPVERPDWNKMYLAYARDFGTSREDGKTAIGGKNHDMTTWSKDELDEYRQGSTFDHFGSDWSTDEE